MLSVVSSLLASLSLALKQPLAGYCDVETTHGDALVTKQGDYCTFVRIGGMKRMATRDDITRLANGLRLDLSGALEAKGNAIVGWYLSDPDVPSARSTGSIWSPAAVWGVKSASTSPTFSTSAYASGVKRCAGRRRASSCGRAARC
jgi:hypothetical protein